MAFSLRLLACLLLFVFLSSGSESIYAQNPKAKTTIRIGVIQHFGKKQTAKNLLIRPKDPSDYLEIITPASPSSYEYRGKEQISPEEARAKQLKLAVTNFPLKNNGGKRENLARLVVGSYRSFESALAGKQELEELFPKQEWLVVYPDPWQIWSYTDYSAALTKKLTELKRDFIWLEKPAPSSKVITWENQGFRFHRRKILIRAKKGGNLLLNQREYPGQIEIKKDSFGTYSVINELLLEEYLRGVLPFEIGVNAPLEAAKAQAVLARTYALANLQRFQPEDYNLCATQHCQVYKGLTYSQPKIDRAVKETENQVLQDPSLQNQVAQIFYYSSDGGHSADYQDNWLVSLNSTSSAKFNNLTGIKTCSKVKQERNFNDPNFLNSFFKQKASILGCLDADSPHARWYKNFSLNSLNKQLKTAKTKWEFNWPDFQKVKDISVKKISRTGHVLELLVITKDPSKQFLVLKDDIRAALGVKSTFFILEKAKNGDFQIYGAGFGHGVGLSQYGAIKLAKLKKNYREILSFYFPRYQLKSLSTD